MGDRLRFPSDGGTLTSGSAEDGGEHEDAAFHLGEVDVLPRMRSAMIIETAR